MSAPAPMIVQVTGNPHAEEMNRLRPYSVLALVKSWKKIVTQENVWCVTGLKRSERYSMTVVTRLRRHRAAKTKYPKRKLAALPM